MKKNKPLQYVTIEIEQDDSAGNPRDEFDNLSTFYGPENGRYIVGGKNDCEVERYSLPEIMREFKREGAVIVPFTSNAGECFAVVERSQMQKEYLAYGYSMRKALYHARQCAKGEISEFLAWANGEVYGYKITDNETGEELDSCWGYYGREYCEEEAQSQAEYFDDELAQKQAQIESRLSKVTEG